MSAPEDLFDRRPVRPAPIEPSRVRLRPVADGDRFLIRRWLALDHVAAWFGSRSAGEAAVAIAADMPTAVRRIFEVDGTPAGYCHAVDADTHFELTLKRARHDAIPAGAWLAEIFVADAALRGRGVGAVAVQRLRDEVFATTLAPALVLVAGVRHERQVRSIERAGFHWTAVIDGGAGRAAWLMIAQRPSSI